VLAFTPSPLRRPSSGKEITVPSTPPAAVEYDGFNFVLEIEGRTVAGFSEASGLAETSSGARWRLGDGIVDTIRKIFGLKKHTDLTLERGVTGSTALWDWWRESRDGSARGGTRELVVRVRDESGRAARAWRVENARCHELVGVLDPKGVSTAIESVEITCERVRPV
jgi:phage tail-like protein